MFHKAAANFTISTGERLSPGFPPIVPLIPEIDFISAIYISIYQTHKGAKKSSNHNIAK